MKKLNNKGMTIVEILITFVIIASITVSLYASIASLKNKEEVASYKESITTYKNLLTREIENDIIMKKLKATKNNTSNHITLVFKNGEEKELSITKSDLTIPKNPRLCRSESNGEISNKESIKYGEHTYPLPVLGSDNIITANGCRNINKLKIANSTLITAGYNNQILIIVINLEHPDLGSKYSIKITAPINND